MHTIDHRYLVLLLVFTYADPSLPPPYKQATTQNVKGTNVFIQNM